MRCKLRSLTSGPSQKIAAGNIVIIRDKADASHKDHNRERIMLIYRVKHLLRAA